jgi:hypothetical protein
MDMALLVLLVSLRCGMRALTRLFHILVQAYLFIVHRGLFFFEAFCHNFAENGPQDLKMV